MSSRIAGSSTDVSRFRILLESAQTILAKACLGVLLRVDEHVNKDNVDDDFPLAQYAAKHWVDHTQFENASSHI
jgi:phosphoserine aminotransferase